MADNWIVDEIVSGFQVLYCLSALENRPAEEVIGSTARVWASAITYGCEWDRDRDAKRFRAAFATLAKTRRAWPTPADFLDALPKPDVKALPAPRPSIEEIMRQYGFDPG